MKLLSVSSSQRSIFLARWIVPPHHYVPTYVRDHEGHHRPGLASLQLLWRKTSERLTAAREHAAPLTYCGAHSIFATYQQLCAKEIPTSIPTSHPRELPLA
ncbi:unnamed protein product [Amoebophrya sp. A25]|nr:unnamed protein product [Amoebophrya sp. A25]|eukprot:GSA25T00025534001.1